MPAAAAPPGHADPILAAPSEASARLIPGQSMPAGRIADSRLLFGHAATDSFDAAQLIQKQQDSLERWALANQRDARRDRYRYWALKTPAILCAASTSALEAFHYGAAVLIMGVLAAVCVAIDAALPGGMLHNVHVRAFSELRVLTNAVKLRWDRATIDHRSSPDDLMNAASELLRYIEEERARISKYLSDAEGSLGVNRTVGNQSSAS